MKKNQTVTATEEKKPAKWVLSKEAKIDAFERMCEEAWTNSCLEDESIKQKVHDKLAKWYKLDSASPLAGYSKYHRPQSQEQLEMDMYEVIDIQLSRYDGYREDDIVQEVKRQDMEQIVRDEKLEKAEWEYSHDASDDSPYVEATTTIDGDRVTVGYLCDDQKGGCYVHINGRNVRDRGLCDHCCEVVEKAIGKVLTGLPYWLWESWAECHGLYENWEDMDDDERYELYLKAVVRC